MDFELPMTVELPDGTEHEFVFVCEVSPLIKGRTYGPPEDCYPDEGGEIESCEVRDGESSDSTPSIPFDEWAERMGFDTKKADKLLREIEAAAVQGVSYSEPEDRYPDDRYEYDPCDDRDYDRDYP